MSGAGCVAQGAWLTSVTGKSFVADEVVAVAGVRGGTCIPPHMHKRRIRTSLPTLPRPVRSSFSHSPACLSMPFLVVRLCGRPISPPSPR